MPQCYVETCGNYYEKTRGSKDIIYHMLPGDRVLALKWIRACGKKEQKVPHFGRICSNHFSEKCYQRDLQHELLGLPLRRKLRAGAIPDTNLPKPYRPKPNGKLNNKILEITNDKQPALSNPDITIKNETGPKAEPAKRRTVIEPLRPKQKSVIIAPVPPLNAPNKKKTNASKRLLPKLKLSPIKVSRPKYITPKTIVINSSPEISEIEIIAQNSMQLRKNTPTKIFDFKIPGPKILKTNGEQKHIKDLKAIPLANNELQVIQKDSRLTILRTTIDDHDGILQDCSDIPQRNDDLNVMGYDSRNNEVLQEKEDKDQAAKINNKINKLPMRSSFRIAKKKSIELLSDSFTEKVNSKSQTCHGPEKFTDKLKFMAKLQLKFERKENFVSLPTYDLEASIDKMMKQECGITTNSEGSYERDVQHELLGLPTRCRLKRGAIPDQNLPNDFLKEEKLPESAIAILLAVGLVPTNKPSNYIGGLPQDLNKMQIMEDVREGCDANPPSSPGHAEQRHGGVQLQLEEELKTEDVSENGVAEDDKKEDKELGNVVVSIKAEQDEKKSDEEIDDKNDENSSSHSSTSENNNKRKLENEHSPIKRLRAELEENFVARDKIMNEFVEVAECNNLEQIQSFSDQILSEIKTLNELAKEKEREWNHILHMKKLKEELLIRLQRKRQVLIINDSDLNEYQLETNGQQSLLKCSQKVNMLRELRAANLEKLKQRNNMLNSAYKQKPMLDVQSIIADYRQRHPETVPRRGRRIRHSHSDGKTSILGFSGGNLTIGQKSGLDQSEVGIFSSMNGSQEDSRSSTQNPWYHPGDDIKSYKDILLQFAKLSQSEKSELQMQLHNTSKPPPPYPEVTVHPVTSTSSVAPTNSLLHGILTKAPVRQNNPNGSNVAAANGEKTSFSPTLARLLTTKAANSQITSTPTMLGESIVNPSNMSIAEIFSGNKARNEITITPVGSQFETTTKRESIEEESEDPADRLVIDEALENSNLRNKEDNRSEDGEDVPQCQGCNQKAAQFVCAGCGNQWYCSRDCQVASWDDHSEVCSG